MKKTKQPQQPKPSPTRKPVRQLDDQQLEQVAGGSDDWEARI